MTRCPNENVQRSAFGDTSPFGKANFLTRRSNFITTCSINTTALYVSREYRGEQVTAWLRQRYGNSSVVCIAKYTDARLCVLSPRLEKQPENP